MNLRNLTLEQLIRLTMATQIVVATSLLSMGERNWWLTLTTIVMLSVSAYVTDHQQRFRLKQPMADFAALCIVSFSLVYALRTDRQGILVAVANLQSYLQYVLMFQPKSARVYWQLAMLSLGQMAIGSTLVPGPAFGVLLLAYLLAGLVTFSLLLLQQESIATAGDLDSPNGPGADDHFASDARSRRSLAFRPVGASTVGLLLGKDSAPADSFTVLYRLARAALMISAISVTMAAALFFSLPRWTVPNIESDVDAPLRTVGFSKTVTLGELGEVVQNSDVVMRIQFFRGRSSRPMKLEGEPLFRGTVVSRYADRVWSQSSRSSAVAMSHDAGSTMVRQRITTQPLDVPELFCIFPVHAIDEPDSRLRVDTYTGQLFRHQDFQSQTIDIEVGTTGITGNKQRTVLPSNHRVPPPMLDRLLQIPEGAEKGVDLFPKLRQLALQILSDKGIDPETDRMAAAKALSDYFHTSGQFFYSLDPQSRDPKLDPLEDFITLHRAGHCEYFAGALTLMLRSLEIPARMAIGFKGGEWNPLGMYYQVQQLHAHAWVEVYLEEEQIPELAFEGEDLPPAAWLVLDPTEGTQEIGADTRSGGFLTRISQSLDYASVLWNNYVVGLNPKVQRQGIYEPLAAGLEAAVDNVTSVQRWQARLNALEESRLGRFWQWYRRHWFSWRGGLVAVGFSLAVSGLFLLTRYLLRKMFGRWLGTAARNEGPPVLEMYRRLESVLAQQGLARQPSQTAFEFAVVAGGELAGHAQHRRVAHLPRRIVELFYRVRFGGNSLDSQEAEAVEHALAELELALAAPP